MERRSKLTSLMMAAMTVGFTNPASAFDNITNEITSAEKLDYTEEELEGDKHRSDKAEAKRQRKNNKRLKDNKKWLAL